MLVQDLMTTGPLTVGPHVSLKEALTLLDTHDVTALPVVTPDGTIAGVVSEADLIRDLIASDPRLQDIPARSDGYARSRVVGDVMSPHAVTVRPDTDLATSDDRLEGQVDTLLMSAGLRDWLVEVHDGIVELSGTSKGHERTIATVIAGTVPGVLEVRSR